MPYMIVISSGLAFLSASLAVTVMTDSFCKLSAIRMPLRT